MRYRAIVCLWSSIDSFHHLPRKINAKKGRDFTRTEFVQRSSYWRPTRFWIITNVHLDLCLLTILKFSSNSDESTASFLHLLQREVKSSEEAVKV